MSGKIDPRDLYSNDLVVHEQYKVENNKPNLTHNELNQLLKLQWDTLSDSDKEPWSLMSIKNTYRLVPKRPKSAYMHYSNDPEIRDPIKEKYPDWKVTKIASYLGDQWNKFSLAERDKWVQLANKEKEELAQNPILQIKKKKKELGADDNISRLNNLEKLIHQLENQINTIKSGVENI